MPLILGAATTLVHIDAQPSDEELKSANLLIVDAMPAQASTTFHPMIPALPETKFSDLIEAEHARIAAGIAKDGGIDLSRYEALDAPERGDVDAWRTTLAKAHASAEYLHGRELNLGLLETYGKNAWLTGNSQLEDMLKSVEDEVEAAKLELEALEHARRGTQQNAAGEMQSLAEAWRKGVGRMIETQAAAERLRGEILERKRIAAS